MPMPYKGKASDWPIKNCWVNSSWSSVNLLAPIIETRGIEKIIKYIMNGTVKKRIWLIPCLKSFLNWSIFSFAQLSDSSVKRAVVIGTVKMEYGSVYQRRAYAATEAPDAETLSC